MKLGMILIPSKKKIINKKSQKKTGPTGSHDSCSTSGWFPFGQRYKAVKKFLKYHLEKRGL